jgi:hypothetical protein
MCCITRRLGECTFGEGPGEADGGDRCTFLPEDERILTPILQRIRRLAADAVQHYVYTTRAVYLHAQPHHNGCGRSTAAAATGLASVGRGLRYDQRAAAAR